MTVVNMKSNYIDSYRDLKVFQRAYAVSLSIHKCSLTFPKIEQYALADQLRRSSKSICANITEGFIRQRDSKLEWKRFLIIALGSCEETMMWLDFARDLGYVDEAQCKEWHEECHAISKMIHKLRELAND